jgi:multiple sugar transport system permease protein/raffinose/stachyose/melibiose transport system permease protein
MLVYLAGLQSIPASVYEAATIDGASKGQQFARMTFPLLRPTTFFLFVMACIGSFQVFGQVYIMTGGGPLNSTTTIVHQIYQNGFQGYKMGFASAQAVFLLLLILALTLTNFAYGSSREGGDVA